MNNTLALNCLKNQVIENLATLGYEPSMSVNEVSFTLKRKKSEGVCKRDANGFTIKLNPNLTTCFKALNDVLVHELIHTIDGCFDHGVKFKHICKLYNNKYNTNVKSRFDYSDYDGYEDSIDNHKYALRCKKCGRMIYYDRMCEAVKHPEYYNHNRDGGELERIK